MLKNIVVETKLAQRINVIKCNLKVIIYLPLNNLQENRIYSAKNVFQNGMKQQINMSNQKVFIGKFTKLRNQYNNEPMVISVFKALTAVRSHISATNASYQGSHMMDGKLMNTHLEESPSRCQMRSDPCLSVLPFSPLLPFLSAFCPSPFTLCLPSFLRLLFRPAFLLAFFIFSL